MTIEFDEYTNLDDVVCDILINGTFNNGTTVLKFNSNYHRKRYKTESIFQSIRNYCNEDCSLLEISIDVLSICLSSSIQNDQNINQFKTWLKELWDWKSYLLSSESRKTKSLEEGKKKSLIIPKHLIKYTPCSKASKWLKEWFSGLDKNAQMIAWITSLQHLQRYLSLYNKDAGYEIDETTRYKALIKKIQLVKDTIASSNHHHYDNNDNKENMILEENNSTLQTGHHFYTKTKASMKPSQDRTDLCLVSLKEWKPNDVITFCPGFLIPIPEASLEKLNQFGKDFSVLYSFKQRGTFLLLGPARFINHDCTPNVKFVSKVNNDIEIHVIKPIKINEEILVYYGDHYFGINNAECLCSTCERLEKGSFGFLKRQNFQSPIMNTEQTLRIYPLALQKIRNDENHIYLKTDLSTSIELDPSMIWSSYMSQRKDDTKSLPFINCTNTSVPLSSVTKKRSRRLTEKAYACTGANKRLNEILLLNSTLPFSAFINQDGLLMCSVCLIRRAVFPIWRLCDHCYRHWNVFKMFWPLRAPC